MEKSILLHPKVLQITFLIYIASFCLGARFDEWPIIFAIPFLLVGLTKIWKNEQGELFALFSSVKLLKVFACWQLFFWAIVALFFWFTNTWGFDTLSYSQSIAHFSIDGNYYNRSLNMNALCDHFTASLLVFSPFFLLFKTNLWLILARVIAYGVSVWLLYKIASHFSLTKLAKTIIIFIYLIYYPASVLLSYDFQPSNFALLLLPLVFYLWINKKYFLFAFAILFSIFLKENMALILCIIGLYALLFEGKAVIGSLMLIFGFAASFLIFHNLTPLVTGCHNFHSNYIQPFANADKKAEMVFNLLIGVGFLPLLNWRYLVLIFASLGLSFISGVKEMATIGFHYHDIATATIFICMILLFRDLKIEKIQFNSWKSKLIFSIIFSSILLYNKYPPTAHIWKHFPQQQDVQIFEAVKELRKKIKSDEELWVQNSIAQHFMGFKNLNSIQFLQSISSVDDMLQRNTFDYLVITEKANRWPIDESFDSLVIKLDDKFKKGEIVKLDQYYPLLVYQNVK